MAGLSSAGELDVALAVIRVVVGALLAMHGSQKLFGAFGGGGLAGTARWFASLGFSNGRAAALAAGTGELVGGLGLALGIVTVAAVAVMIGVMTTAAIVNHADGGFWSVSKGWELNLYLMLMAWFVAAAGPGKWSVDAAWGLEVHGPLVASVAAVLGVLGGVTTWRMRHRFL